VSDPFLDLVAQMQQSWPQARLGSIQTDELNELGRATRNNLSSPHIGRPFQHGLRASAGYFPNIARETPARFHFEFFNQDPRLFGSADYNLPPDFKTLHPQNTARAPRHNVYTALYGPDAFPEFSASIVGNAPMRAATHEAAHRILNSGDLDLEWAARDLADQMRRGTPDNPHMEHFIGQPDESVISHAMQDDLDLDARRAIMESDAPRQQRGLRPYAQPWNAPDDGPRLRVADWIEGDIKPVGGWGPPSGKGLRLLQMAKKASPFMLGLGLLGGAASLLGKNPYSDREDQSLPAALARAGGFA
jgi:hypothetical protein